MSRKLIVVGDPTTGGGAVITGTPFTDIDGSPVARVGDKATCAKCNGTFPIVTGDTTFLIDGQPAARERDALACGCKLMSIRQFRVFLDECTSNDPVADAAMLSAGSPASVHTPLNDPTSKEFDEAFVLTSELTGKPLANRRYRIVRASGSNEEGITDDHGMTHVVKSVGREDLSIEVAQEGPA